MGSLRALVVAVSVAACGHHSGSFQDAAIDQGYVADACEGLGCFQHDCAVKGLPPTTVSGTVFAPNGTLPLYGVDVYVPRMDPGPLPDGVQCTRCDQGLAGSSFTSDRTDENGRFVLENVPATSNVPIIIQVGKWRRRISLANVAACEDQPLPSTETRLPKNSIEGDMPKIAISTGTADALECLILKLGIDPVEIKTNGQGGRVHLYSNVSSAGQGTNQFRAGFAGGTGAFADSQTVLWNDLNKLKEYDITFLSCEGDQYAATKSQTAMDNVKAYADVGGRVFMSHWHNIWIEGASREVAYTQAPAVWTGVATWNDALVTFNSPPSTPDIIDEFNNPKGMSFATWMLNVGGSTVRGEIPISQGKQTATGLDLMKSERWVYWNNGVTPPPQYPQMFQFTTPNEVVLDQRCGKVVFTDMHLSAGSQSEPGAANAYPNLYSTLPLTEQEKALAFMFFDIASCIGSIF
jgi:hypothetical protein